MSDYNFSNLKSFNEKRAGGSALSEGIYIILLNVHKTPPHLAVMANGIICSLSASGGFKRNEGVNELLRTIELKRLPTLFIELRKPPHIEIGSKYLKSIFANIENNQVSVNSNGATCLLPVKEFCKNIYNLDLSKVNLLFDLLPKLDKINAIEAFYHFNLEPYIKNGNFSLEKYGVDDVNSIINNLQNTIHNDTNR